MLDERRLDVGTCREMDCQSSSPILKVSLLSKSEGILLKWRDNSIQMFWNSGILSLNLIGEGTEVFKLRILNGHRIRRKFVLQYCSHNVELAWYSLDNPDHTLRHERYYLKWGAMSGISLVMEEEGIKKFIKTRTWSLRRMGRYADVGIVATLQEDSEKGLREIKLRVENEDKNKRINIKVTARTYSRKMNNYVIYKIGQISMDPFWDIFWSLR